MASSQSSCAMPISADPHALDLMVQKIAATEWFKVGTNNPCSSLLHDLCSALDNRDAG